MTTRTNYTFPCATVNALKAAIAESVAYRRQEKEATKIYKARKATERREAAIAKAQARLDRLMAKANPVGAKAAKANRKPSAVTVSASL